MAKVNWNEKRDNLVLNMKPVIIWDKGSDAQQEYADKIVDNFCKRVCKILCWAIKDEIVEETIVDAIVNEIYCYISNTDDARWWCNKKDIEDIKLIQKLLENEEYKKIVKKIYKNYE